LSTKDRNIEIAIRKWGISRLSLQGFLGEFTPAIGQQKVVNQQQH